MLVFTTALLLLGCDVENAALQELESVDSLIDKGDYQLACDRLAVMGKTEMVDSDAWHYYQLLKTRVLFSLRKPVVNDSAIDDCITYYKRMDDKDKYIQSLYYKGMLLSNEGKTAEAVTLAKEAEHLASGLGNQTLLYRIYSNLSYFNMIAGNDAKALQYARNTYQAAVKSGNDNNVANALERLCAAFTRLQEYDSVKHYNKALMGYVPHVVKADKARILATISANCYNVGERELSRQYACRSLKEAPNHHAYYMLGVFYIQEGNEGKTWELWTKALETKDLEIRTEVLRYMAEFKKSAGEYQEALRLNDSLLFYLDSLKRQKQQEKLLVIQEGMDNDFAMKKSEHSIFAIFIVSSIVTALLALSFITYRKRFYRSEARMSVAQDQINEYERKLKEVEAKATSRDQELANMSQLLDAMRKQKAGIVGRGKVLYDAVKDGGTKTGWQKDDYERFVEHCRAVNPGMVEQVENGYSGLSSRQLTYLLLMGMDVNVDDIPFVLNMSKGAIRTMRYRIASKKKE